jgi:hypothetical protein
MNTIMGITTMITIIRMGLGIIIMGMAVGSR